MTPAPEPSPAAALLTAVCQASGINPAYVQARLRTASTETYLLAAALIRRLYRAQTAPAPGTRVHSYPDRRPVPELVEPARCPRDGGVPQ